MRTERGAENTSGQKVSTRKMRNSNIRQHLPRRYAEVFCADRKGSRKHLRAKGIDSEDAELK